MLDPMIPAKEEFKSPTTAYEMLKHRLNNKIENEKDKYPLTAREQILIETINQLLDILDYKVRSEVLNCK